MCVCVCVCVCVNERGGTIEGYGLCVVVSASECTAP